MIGHDTELVVDVCERPGTVICRIGPMLDFRNAARFQAQCENLMRLGTRTFILDFSLTSVLDSTGLGSLFRLFRQLKPHSGCIAIASPSPSVSAVLDLTKCDTIFGRHASVQAALDGMTPGERNNEP